MIVARSGVADSPGAPGVELIAPEVGRSVADGDGALLLGFPAAPDRTPWSRVEAAERERLLAGAVRGDVRLAGRWTLLAREGNELVVRSDEFGTRPLYWRSDGERVELADEIWSLATRSRALDPHGVADFLLTGVGIGERTIFDGVHSTRPDGILRARGAVVSRRVLAADPPLAVGPSLDDAMDALEEQLVRMLDPFGDVERAFVSLSGGLDSRALLGVARESGIEIEAFTFVLVEGSLEERIAKRVAAAWDVPHRLVGSDAPSVARVAEEFVRRGSGQISLEHVHAYSALDLMPDVPLVLNGAFGDVICGGSRVTEPDLAPSEIPASYARLVAGGRVPEDLDRWLPGVEGWGASLTEHVRALYAEVGEDPNSADRLLTRDRPARFNAVSDASIRHRLESAAGFFDGELARACYGIDVRWRRRWDAYRGVLLRRWPELAPIPWQKTGVPIDRYPVPRRGVRAALMRRLTARRRAPFTDQSVYVDSLSDRLDRACARLGPILVDIGIDLPGLLAAEPAGTARGGALRLRVATLELSLELAGILERTEASSSRSGSQSAQQTL